MQLVDGAGEVGSGRNGGGGMAESDVIIISGLETELK